MAGQMVHLEIPAGDPAKAQEFWGSLFGWQFQEFPGAPGGYYMTRFSENTGGAIYGADGAARGTRTYFDVDDVNSGAARVKELGGEAGGGDSRSQHGLVLDLQGPGRQRVRPLADRRQRSGRVRPTRGRRPSGRRPGPSRSLAARRVWRNGSVPPMERRIDAMQLPRSAPIDRGSLRPRLAPTGGTSATRAIPPNSPRTSVTATRKGRRCPSTSLAGRSRASATSCSARTAGS